MEFNENFVEVEAGEITKKWQSIYAYNILTARMIPELIDGLKPVTRRALYIMYQKDGGKSFRKVLAISGDVVGKVHPHASTAVESAIVGNAQPWNNSIPLIEGSGNYGNCVSADTKFLTKSGWKYGNELSTSDMLASVDPATGNLIFEHPAEIFAYPYKGKMIHGKHHHSLDFLVTPDHNMLLRRYSSKKRKFYDPEFYKAGELPAYGRLIDKWYHYGTKAGVITLPELVVGKNIQRTLSAKQINLETWVRFLGIYLADGYVGYYKNHGYTTASTTINVTTKTRKIKYYQSIMDAMGYPEVTFSKASKGFIIHDPRIADELRKLGIDKTHARDKFVPDFIFDLDYTLIEKFLFSFAMGDGSISRWNATSFWTGSEKMAEQLEILSWMCGKPARMYEIEPRTTQICGKQLKTFLPQYGVYQRYSKARSIDKSLYVTEEDYEGMVYCADMPTYHTLIIKRGDCTMLVGNCHDEKTEVLIYGNGKVEWVPWPDFYDDHSGKKLGSINIETGEWLWEEPTNLIKYNLAEKFPDEPEKRVMIVGTSNGKGGAPSGSRDSSGGGTTGMSAMSGAPFDDPKLNNPIDLGETPPAPTDANKFADFMVTEDHNMVIKSISPTPEEDKFEFRAAGDLPEVFKLRVKDVVIPKERNGFKEHQMLPDESLKPYGMWEPGKEYKEPDDLVWVLDAFGKKNLPIKLFFKVISIFLAYGKLTPEKIILNAGMGNVDISDIANIFEMDKTSITDGGIISFIQSCGEPIYIPPEEPEEGSEEEEKEKEDPYEAIVPIGIYDMNTENLKTFLDVYGEVSGGSADAPKVTTRLVAYQFQAIAVMVGKMGTPGMVADPEGEEPPEDELYFMLQCSENEPVLAAKDNIRTVPYDGDVYCAEMPTNHTIITRRNEVTLLSGNCSGDRAAAPRYIQAKLSDYAIACFFEDWKDSVVDMQLAYDEETMMPDYLPAKYPNVLVNGCLGVGYGFSVRIPSFNFKEVMEATIMLIRDPKSNIILVPDSPTGADIIETDFGSICARGKGAYMQRCKYEIDPEANMITITALPEQTTAQSIRENIASIKEKGGLAELLNMNDLSGKTINIQLIIRDDVNPYKFIKKLISQVSGLEQTYPVSIMVATDYMIFEYSVKQVLLEWIKWRREQKRTSLTNKRGSLYGEQRVNDIKLFIMNPKNLNDTLDIFRHSHNRQEIEEKLIAKYRKTEIMMDSVQARALSNMRMIELTIDAYEGYKKRAEEIVIELNEIEDILNTEHGVDKVIIAELRDGIKRFAAPRKSRVVPYAISVSNEVEGYCILQLSSDGNITRTPTNNVDEEPVPTDTNGFACIVDNDASFILVDDNGYHTFIRVKELPIGTEVPVFRYSKKPLDGKIVAMIPFDIESDKCCTFVSKFGIVKRIMIPEIRPSKKPIITIDKDDRIVKGIVLKAKSQKDLLIYTKDGMGQRLDSNSIRITSPSAKGMSGFKLKKGDEICGVYAISPEKNSYLLYVTTKGKMRLNLIDYLPTRESKHDNMVQLISLNDRDKLVAVLGCNKLDKAVVYYDDGDSETIDIKKLPESTMSSEPKKVTSKNAVSNNITKVKIN